jgi:hypothetical protein
VVRASDLRSQRYVLSDDAARRAALGKTLTFMYTESVVAESRQNCQIESHSMVEIGCLPTLRNQALTARTTRKYVEAMALMRTYSPHDRTSPKRSVVYQLRGSGGRGCALVILPLR